MDYPQRGKIAVPNNVISITPPKMNQQPGFLMDFFRRSVLGSPSAFSSSDDGSQLAARPELSLPAHGHRAY
jgi:hypothetical protein